MQKYYIFLNLGPAAGPAQANTTVLQLPIIETRAEVLLGLARADGPHLLSIAQEYSRSSDGLLPSMCGRTNGRLSADTGPAFVLTLTKKIFRLTSTSVLVI
jgi:hypothetical protein